MPYSNNVPQGNQQIAATQSPILANFTFLPIGIGAEHNFNAAGTGSDMYHLQASMPNRSGGDPSSLPAGTNGMYYVLGGIPKFYNAAKGAQTIALGSISAMVPFNGTITNLAKNTSANFTPTINGNVAGLISVTRSDGQFTSWVFFQNSTAGYGNNAEDIADTSGGHIDIFWSSGILSLSNLGSSTYSFKYSGFYYPTV